MAYTEICVDEINGIYLAEQIFSFETEEDATTQAGLIETWKSENSPPGGGDWDEGGEVVCMYVNMIWWLRYVLCRIRPPE